MPRLSPLRIAALLGLVLCGLRFGGCHYLHLVDVRAVDYRLLQRGVEVADPRVIVVAIDDASLEELGRWPWSRALVARLVERLVAGGAAAIGFDIVESEATVPIDIDAVRARVEGVDERTWAAVRQALREGGAQDRLLADAVRRSQRTALGYFFDFGEPAQDTRGVRISTYNVVQNSPGGRGETRVPLAPMARANLPELTAAAREVGYFNFLPDADGSCRRVPLAIRFGDQIAVPLSLALLRVYRPDAALAIRFADYGVQSVRWGSVSIPVAEDGQMLINYRGPERTFRYVSAADVLAERPPAAVVRDKLVLVGVTAAALADVRVTPFAGFVAGRESRASAGSMPGVEIHANVLDNILRGDFIMQPKWAVLIDVAVIAAMALVLGLLLHYARGLSGALVTLGLLAGYVVGSQWLFLSSGWPLSFVYPLLAIILTYVAVSLHHYLVEAAEKRKIRTAFGLYLSPSLVRLVSEQPQMLKLGGDKRELTVMFSDIRGFTSISERFEPEVLVEILNEFLGGMTDVIFAHDGTLDKYIGDAIMAVWGAPVPQTDHAVRACQAAVGMVSRLRLMGRDWLRRGLPILDIGIGLNSGPMVVGNMGSARRLSYTVIGDNVNLGARLESLNKLYGSSIIAAESTVQAAAGVVVARELDLVRVKGKRQAVRIFEILGLASEREQWAPLLDLFAAGLAAYRKRRWGEAVTALNAVLAAYPHDGPAMLYLERCRAMLETPPAAEWDAVTVMEAK
jgi:adenylate cyclase